jgi:hypothetical protein
MAERAPILVRTSVVQHDSGAWMVRVQVEQGATAKPLFLGPFADRADADENGRKIAKLVKKALGIADA